MAPSLDDLNAFANQPPPAEPVGSRTFMWPKVSYVGGVSDTQYTVERRYMNVFGTPLQHWLHTVMLFPNRQDLIEATAQPLILRGCWFLSWYMREVSHLNDDLTRYELYHLMRRHVESMLGDTLCDGKPVVDASNNSPDIVDARRLRADLYFKPSKSLLLIHLPLESGTQAELDEKWDAWNKMGKPA